MPRDDELPSLAVASYSSLQVDDSAGILNLCWTSDERVVLDADVLSIAQDAWGGNVLQRYLVSDPYGELCVGDALKSYLGLTTDQVVCSSGAGVGALLAAVARLGNGARYWAHGVVYPDIVRWLHLRGGKMVQCSEADLIVVERPSVLGEQLSLENLEELLERTQEREPLVVIDESNANYEPPDYSAASLFNTDHADRLIVLRGLSKAYGLGALRFGCAVTTIGTASLLRKQIPPLQVATPSLEAARRIYELGDIGATLRATIADRKMKLASVLRQAGNLSARPSHGHLPYVLSQEDAISTWKSNVEIRGKVHRGWGFRGPKSCGRYSVPFEESRWARVTED